MTSISRTLCQWDNCTKRTVLPLLSNILWNKVHILSTNFQIFGSIHRYSGQSTHLLISWENFEPKIVVFVSSTGKISADIYTTKIFCSKVKINEHYIHFWSFSRTKIFPRLKSQSMKTITDFEAQIASLIQLSSSPKSSLLRVLCLLFWIEFFMDPFLYESNKLS